MLTNLNMDELNRLVEAGDEAGAFALLARLSNFNFPRLLTYAQREWLVDFVSTSYAETTNSAFNTLEDQAQIERKGFVGVQNQTDRELLEYFRAFGADVFDEDNAEALAIVAICSNLF